MSEISICTCTVALAGDITTTVHRGPSRPVTWPEVEVLMDIHGEDAITDIEVIGTDDTTNAAEYERLTLKYGQDVTAKLFPGKRPAILLKAPDHIPRADPFAGAEPEPKAATAAKAKA